MKPIIKNCVLEFQCPKSWNTLKVLEGNSNARHCDDCNQTILLCETEEQLNDAIEKRICVAVDYCELNTELRVLGFPSNAKIPSFLEDDEK